MSGKFNGFTKDDINKITTKSNKEIVNRPVGIRRVIDKQQQQVTQKNQQKTNNRVNNNNNNGPVKSNIGTDKPPDIINNDSDSTEESLNNLNEAVYFKPLPNIKKCPPGDESILPSNQGNSSDNDEINKNEIDSPFRGMSLKDFETQRRFIEEQNKLKKDLIYKAIEQRSERTAAEARRIQEVKKELAKLDSDLANDVAILRKQIESASFQYMQVQKNYENIESLFLKAKMDLHNAQEKKELLTEHLCTIIAHNEDRKAKKLTDLMEKIGLEGENPEK